MITYKTYVSIPSRGLGGANERIAKSKANNHQFPYPREDWGDLTKEHSIYIFSIVVLFPYPRED